MKTLTPTLETASPLAGNPALVMLLAGAETASSPVEEIRLSFNKTLKKLGATLVLNDYDKATDTRTLVYSASTVENGFPFTFFEDTKTLHGIRPYVSEDIEASFLKMGWKELRSPGRGKVAFSKGGYLVTLSAGKGSGLAGKTQGLVLTIRPQEA